MKKLFKLTLKGRIIPKKRANVNTQTHNAVLPKNYRDWKKQSMLTLGQQWEEIASNQQIQKASLWVYVHPKTLGDADNILGAIMDCLVQSGIIADDYLKNIPRAHVKIKSYLEETNEIFIRVHEWGREIVNLPLATEENYSEEFPDVF